MTVELIRWWSGEQWHYYPEDIELRCLGSCKGTAQYPVWRLIELCKYLACKKCGGRMVPVPYRLITLLHFNIAKAAETGGYLHDED